MSDKEILKQVEAKLKRMANGSTQPSYFYAEVMSIVEAALKMKKRRP